MAGAQQRHELARPAGRLSQEGQGAPDGRRQRSRYHQCMVSIRGQAARVVIPPFARPGLQREASVASGGNNDFFCV